MKRKRTRRLSARDAGNSLINRMRSGEFGTPGSRPRSVSGPADWKELECVADQVRDAAERMLSVAGAIRVIARKRLES